MFYGVLAAYLFGRFAQPAARATVATGAIVAIAAVAFSRVYLGAHYPSDVIAAMCTSSMWLVACLSRR